MNDAIHELARQHLTAKQLEAWEHIHVHRYSIRGAAVKLALPRSTFVDRYDAACLRMQKAGVYVNASNVPYLEETHVA